MRRRWPEAALAGLVIGIVAPIVVMFLLSFFVPYCVKPPAGPMPTSSFAGPAVPRR